MTFRQPLPHQLPISDAVDLIRRAKGWSKAEMARQLQIHPTALSCKLNRKWVYSVRTIELIREVSGIDPYVLAFVLWGRHENYSTKARELLLQLKDVLGTDMETLRRGRSWGLPWSDHFVLPIIPRSQT